MFVRSNWKSPLFVLNELCNVFNTGNGALVAWRCVELTTKLSLFLVETLPFYYWIENDRFKEGSLDSFHVIPGSEQADEGTEEDGPATNPLRLHRVYRSWGTKGKVLHILSLVEHSYQQGMSVQLGNSITALVQVFLPPLFSIEQENEWL